MKAIEKSCLGFDSLSSSQTWDWKIYLIVHTRSETSQSVQKLSIQFIYQHIKHYEKTIWKSF